MKKLTSAALIIFMVFCFLCHADEADTFWSIRAMFDCPVYGNTKADLDPILRYMDALHENGILFELPDLLISNKEGYDRISSYTSEAISLTYIYRFDENRYSMTVDIPDEYRPQQDALILLIASMLDIDKSEAAGIYGKLYYNAIPGQWIKMDGAAYTIRYYEANGIKGLIVEISK